MADTTPFDLRALADRCEAAEGASRELDAEIAPVIGWLRDIPEPYTYLVWVDTAGARHSLPPRYTASLDAAMTLVPKDVWNVSITTLEEGRYEVALNTDQVDVMAAAISRETAICAAALRLRAAMMEAAS